MLQNCKCLLFPPGLLSVALGNNSDSFRNVTVTTVESGKKMSAVFAISIATSLQNTNKNGWIIAFPTQLNLKCDLLCLFPFWLKRIWNFGHIYSIIVYLDSYKTFMVMLIMFLFCRLDITSPRLPKWQPDWNRSRKCYWSTNEFISRLILVLIHCTHKSCFTLYSLYWISSLIPQWHKDRLLFVINQQVSSTIMINCVSNHPVTSSTFLLQNHQQHIQLKTS